MGMETLICFPLAGTRISYAGRDIFFSRTFAGEVVALKPNGQDGVFDVLYAGFVIDKLDCTRAS
jgi:hypothetical protein